MSFCMSPYVLELYFQLNEYPCILCVAGKYRTQLWDKQTAAFLPSTPGLGMHVEVKDPDTKVRQDQK